MQGTIVKLGLALCLVAALTPGARVEAHHPYVVTYIDSQVQTIEGELVQVIFRNPHSFVLVMAPDERGSIQRWVVEWRAGAQLVAQGVTPMTLVAGDLLVLTGNPGRYPADHRLRMKSVVRPSDGWAWRETGLR